MKYYIAYGSNLNRQQMALRCPNARPFIAGRLMDYELMFKGSKTGSYATVEAQERAFVPVGVWRITKADERALDRYEGFPTFYYKKEVEVQTIRGPVTGLVYIMHEDRPFGMPSDQYNEICMQGYDDFGLNKLDYYDAIMSNMLRMERETV